MSKGYFERKRRQHIIAFLIAAIVLFLALFSALAVRMLKTSGDAELGTIEQMEQEKDADPEGEDAEKEAKSDPLNVLVVDVGDAEAVLIDCGNVEILYDCGNEKDGEKVAKKIGEYVEGPLEYLILSHSHADHVGGAPSVLKKYLVETIITSGEKKGTSAEFDAAMKAANAEGGKILEDADLTFDIGSGATLNIIETYDPGQQEEDNPNNFSVIAYVTSSAGSVLVTGDSEAEAERLLKGKIRNVSVYIAAHHMSSTSNSADLLSEWDPDYIIASCAGPKKSEYGFPHEQALARCRAVCSEIYATYKSGDILITLDENEGASIDCSEEDRL